MIRHFYILQILQYWYLTKTYLFNTFFLNLNLSHILIKNYSKYVKDTNNKHIYFKSYI